MRGTLRKELRNNTLELVMRSGREADWVTLGKIIDKSREIRVDNKVTGCNKEGKECVLVLLGDHVYTLHSKEMLQAVKQSMKEIDSMNDSDVIIEMDENNKKILEVK